MEKPTEAGAISRSPSNSRKSRTVSTGYRRISPPRNIGSFLSCQRLSGARTGLVCAGYPTLATRAIMWQRDIGLPDSRPSELVDPGPDPRRIVVTRQPQHRLPARVPGLEAGITGKAVLTVWPDPLQVWRAG